MGAQAYADVKAKSKLSKEAAANALVRRVGERVAKAADRPDYRWEFILIDDPKTVNAFCLPGGRVAVYTGILPITRDENGLAVVLSHEVSHALARHGAERMSDQMAAGLIEQAAVLAGVINTAEGLRNVELVYGVAGELPHSRKQESEADHIGLILMAKAGYDPRGALEFWQRMAKANAGSSPPAFLSDHPSDEKRLSQIRAELPEALTYYHP